jgi:carbonic anhydrase
MRKWILGALLVSIVAPLSAQTADALWQSLMDGNKAYVAGKLTYDHLAEQRRASADKQNPPVAVLSCADSRVPPELIFDRSVDQLFVVRVAGNIPDEFDIASMEFAIANGWTKLIVVLGHDNCGAVKAAMDKNDPPTPALVALVHRIRESFAKKPANLNEGIAENTRGSAAYLTAHSKVIRDAVAAKKVAIVPAVYHLDSGVVDRLK